MLDANSLADTLASAAAARAALVHSQVAARAAALAEALGQNASLTRLHLRGNNVGFDGAEAIGAALEKRKGAACNVHVCWGETEGWYHHVYTGGRPIEVKGPCMDGSKEMNAFNKKHKGITVEYANMISNSAYKSLF